MDKIIRKIHVTDVKAGDTIIHNGKESTVCQKDITHDAFMGTSVFGYNYKSGHDLVEIVDYEQMRKTIIGGKLQMTLEQIKDAIDNKTCIDFHFKDDKPGTWRWMIIYSLSDDESGFYYKPCGTGMTYLFGSMDNIIVDKID